MSDPRVDEFADALREVQRIAREHAAAGHDPVEAACRAVLDAKPAAVVGAAIAAIAYSLSADKVTSTN